MARVTVLLSALFLAAPAAAQESFTPVLKPPAQGDTTTCTDSLTSSMRSRQLAPTGGVVHQESDFTSRQTAYRETVLQVDPATGQVVRLRRHCDKATLEHNGKTQTLPYHARSFVVERDGGACRVRFEGEAPPAELVAKLEESFKQGKGREELLRGLLPGRAVRVGEPWEIDAAPLLAAWPKPPQVRLADAPTVRRGVLREVHEKGGRRHGTFEFEVRVPVVAVEFGERRAEVDAAACLEMRITLDACIDGTSAAYALRLTDELMALFELPLPGGQKIAGHVSERHERDEWRR